jgi:hypothetical protein
MNDTKNLADFPSGPRPSHVRLPSPGLTTLINRINANKVLELNKYAVRLEKIKFFVLFMCGKESGNMSL